MIKDVVKNHIKQIMRQSDENMDDNFLDVFGAYRKKVVYEDKLITIDEFDEICKEIVDED